MKIAVIGDVHLIAESDPYKQLHARRNFFKSGWPSFQRLLERVNDESPDLTILLGDLVDWFSPENIAFGLDLVSALRHPWQMTPGNHDLSAPSGGHDQDTYATTSTRDHLAYWLDQGIDLSNRSIELEDLNLILMDSALSDLPGGTADWLGNTLDTNSHPILFTHVPIDIPETRDYILSVDANRSMAKYVLSRSPDLYAQHIQHRVSQVFSGHLHFAGDLTRDTTRFHLCNMGITMYDPHREQSAVASAAMIEICGDALQFRKLVVEE